MKATLDLHECVACKNGAPRQSSLQDDESGDNNTHIHCCLASTLGSFLRKLPASALLKPNVTFVTIQSTVPLIVCLKAMTEYGREHALVYDPPSGDLIGCIDEKFMLSIFSSLRSDLMQMNCKDVLKLCGHTLDKVTVSASAWNGIEPMLNNGCERLFVWSEEKDVPVGTVTPACYLEYITKELCGNSSCLAEAFGTLSSSNDNKSVDSSGKLKELIDILHEQPVVAITSSDGGLMGVLNRKMVVKYFLSVLKNKETASLSTSIATVLDFLKNIPESCTLIPEAEDNKVIKDEISYTYNIAEDAVFFKECHSGSHHIVAASDVLRYLLQPFL